MLLPSSPPASPARPSVSPSLLPPASPAHPSVSIYCGAASRHSHAPSLLSPCFPGLPPGFPGRGPDSGNLRGPRGELLTPEVLALQHKLQDLSRRVATGDFRDTRPERERMRQRAILAKKGKVIRQQRL